MKNITHIAALLICLLSVNICHGEARENVRKSTDVLMFAPSVAGLATTIALHDFDGFKQLAFSSATSIAASYILKYSVSKRRPDGSDNHAFPSNHTSLAFQGASFIQLRYGWKYSIPAYLVSTYVAWGRMYSKKHDCWDVLAGAAIGVGSSLIFTRPYARKHELAISPIVFDDNSIGVYAGMKF